MDEFNVRGTWDTVDPEIFAQMQQIVQMISSPNAQMMVQQQGQQQASAQVATSTVTNQGV